MSQEASNQVNRYRIAIDPKNWFDRFMEFCAQASGAIVIKEFRQTLKGYQIYVICGLLVVCATLFQLDPLDFFRWSSVVEDDPEWFARLDGFFRMLAAPAFIFIPFWIYRSMAIEFKQGAFELLSITSMPAWRIVVGKMAVASIQLFIYTSIILPFVVLETNSVPVGLTDAFIRLALLYCLCMAISGFAVMLATFINRGTWQIAGMLVVLVSGAILFGYFYNLMFLLRNEPVQDSPGAPTIAPQVINLTLFGASILSLAFCCFSVSKLQFTSANRAAMVRLGFAMLQWGFFAAIAFALINVRSFSVFTVVNLYVGLLCLSVFGGSMLVGDMPFPSQRVIRDNIAWWKRIVWLGWLPGSRRAFVFAISNHMAITGLLILIIKKRGIAEDFVRLIPGLLMGCGYLLTFTVISWLICLPVKKIPSNRVATAGITAICLLVIGSVVPNTISIFYDQSFANRYAPYYVMDMVYTVHFYSRQDTNYDLTVKVTVIIAASLAALTAIMLYLIDEIKEAQLVKNVRLQIVASNERKQTAFASQVPETNPQDPQ